MKLSKEDYQLLKEHAEWTLTATFDGSHGAYALTPEITERTKKLSAALGSELLFQISQSIIRLNPSVQQNRKVFATTYTEEEKELF
jgi:hypothetical protein